MDEQVTIGTIVRMIIPFIQLFGLYVLAHGELGPGGGFQAGVILASSIILYAIVFGRENARKRVNEKITAILSSAGVLIYAGIGIACMVAGGAYLEYSKLPMGSEKFAAHIGIYGIEIGIGIAVAMAVITIYFEMVSGKDD